MNIDLMRWQNACSRDSCRTLPAWRSTAAAFPAGLQHYGGAISVCARARRTHNVACGRLGHWAGGRECRGGNGGMSWPRCGEGKSKGKRGKGKGKEAEKELSFIGRRQVSSSYFMVREAPQDQPTILQIIGLATIASGLESPEGLRPRSRSPRWQIQQTV